MNRTIPSMLNPQKKFYLPVFYELFRLISMRILNHVVDRNIKENILKKRPIFLNVRI